LNNHQEKGCGTHFTCEYPSSQVLQQYSQTKWVPRPFIGDYLIMSKLTHASECDVALEWYGTTIKLHSTDFFAFIILSTIYTPASFSIFIK